jgi:hypothetical protein
MFSQTSLHLCAFRVISASVRLFFLMVVMTQSLYGDEGMWLFNDLPTKHLREKHGFEPTEAWAEHLMRASVRFNSGGSAAFVSPQGLVLTNHHVGADTIQKLSTGENNYYQDGFLAGTWEEELRAPDLELNQLVSIEDVTERVQEAVQPGMSAAEAAAARRAIMAEIEKESLDETGYRSDVITLYGGGKYHLYRYRKYTDVRLVWAPEADAAFFGGDADNFEYPRYCLDVCLFRVYENDEPAQIDHYLKWSKQGADEGELVFVSGNPGRTRRIYTTDALKHQRDHRIPYTLNYLRRREILLQQFGLDGPEAERRASDELFGIQNSRKAFGGMLLGLQDPQYLARRKSDEEAFLEALRQSPDLRGEVEAWEQIAAAQERRVEMLPQTASLGSRLYEIAETLVLMAAEDAKPSSERLREFRDSARESLLQNLYSTAPIYPDLDQALLGDSLGLFVERRGGDHPLVAVVLADQDPLSRAGELVSETRLAEIEYRRELAEGGLEAIQSCEDPLIRLARDLEEEYRRVRAINEELDELETQAYSRIATTSFATQGTSTYPDATFTLRLSFGPVLGYEELGQSIPPWTTLEGAFQHEQRHGATSPWKLPSRFHERRDQLDPDTPFNFVCTADIVGGNSGSPVVNRDGELVGVIFDGNIQSLTGTFYYSDDVARAVAVHSSIVREALEKIYQADRLMEELQP